MTRLFVENIPSSITKSDLSYLFGQFGIVGGIQFKGRNRVRTGGYRQALVDLIRGDADAAVTMLNRDLYDGAELQVRKAKASVAS